MPARCSTRLIVENTRIGNFDVVKVCSSLRPFATLALVHWRYRMRENSLTQLKLRHCSFHNLCCLFQVPSEQGVMHNIKGRRHWLTALVPDALTDTCSMSQTFGIYTFRSGGLKVWASRSAPGYCYYLRSSFSPRLDLQFPLAEMHASTSRWGLVPA